MKQVPPLFILLLLSGGSVSAQSWPKIQSVEQTYRIDSPDKPLTLTIRTSTGASAYEIVCANADTAEIAFGFNFRGDFE
jgi:hypothetical protein